MMLTPQAQRVVSDAVRYLPDPKAREKWRFWAERPNRGDIPPEFAPIVIEALEGMTRKLESLLDSPGLDEDREADILNDLGFVRAIAAQLRRETSVPAH